MSLLADLLSTLIDQRRRLRGGRDDGRAISDLCRDLLGVRGEVSGYALASQILDCYEGFTDADKLKFFRFLTEQMDIDLQAMRAAVETYATDNSSRNYRTLMSAADPARQELARRLNQIPGGTARLVAMRADMLRMAVDSPELLKPDLDFRHLFSSWFSRGFLVLRPITWSSPAKILEDIISYEAVHEITSWDDLRRRLQPADRRCFAFFHPAMPDEPLIFVEVALTQGVPESIGDILAQDRKALHPEETDTAVFYSISNCQAGLAGISFGNSLIKQVVEDLSKEMPQISDFVTLSPIPGLRDWMDETGVVARSAEDYRRIAAHYLLHAKRPDGRPVDPVAGFHLRNGALVMKVHADADLSDRGQALSGGAMVNYLYDLKKITDNHEAFANEARVIAASEIEKLASQPLPEPQEAHDG